jgi:hypothetical protein
LPDPVLGLDPTGQPSRLRLHIPQTSDELNPGDQVRLKAMLYPVPPQILPGGRDFQRESLLFHEYSHLILYASLPFNESSGPTKWKFSQVPIEFGLANYFTASARNRPLIGELAAQVLKTGTPSLSNLENREKVTTLKPSDFAVATKLGDGWGGAFWDIRNRLGQAAADQMIYDAWRQMTDVDDAFVGQSFIRNLLNQARTAGGLEAEEAVRGILHDRGIRAT